MTTDQATRPLPPAVTRRRPARLHAERAGFGLAVRQIWFGALVVTAATGLLMWLGTVAYQSRRPRAGN
jgi:hypothetical protein